MLPVWRRSSGLSAGPSVRPSVRSPTCSPVCYTGERFNIEDEGTDERIMFGNATHNTNLTNAIALDMTYRVLYYGQNNQVRYPDTARHL